jgi:hypothetical protein
MPKFLWFMNPSPMQALRKYYLDFVVSGNHIFDFVFEDVHRHIFNCQLTTGALS